MFLKNTCTLLLIALTLYCCCLMLTAQAAATTTRSGTDSELLKKPDAMTTTETTTINTSTLDRDDDGNDGDDDNDDDDNDDDDGDDDDDDGDDAGVKDSTVAAVAAGKHELEVVNAAGSLSIWSTVRGLWNWLRADLSESFRGKNNAVASRTFGTIRRLQMALIPIIFKFGVLTAMVFFLVLLGLKTIFLLKVLLMMNAIALVIKLLTLKSHVGYVDQSAVPIPKPAPTWGYSGWNSFPAPLLSHAGWSAPEHHPQPRKEVHLHIHGAQVPAPPRWSAHTAYGSGPNKGWDDRSDPYAAYGSAPAEVRRNLDKEPDSSNSFLPIHYTTNYQP